MVKSEPHPILPRWFMPRSFDWVCGILYSGMLITYFSFSRTSSCSCFYDSWWAAPLLVVFIASLIGLDRWEALRYDLVPPKRVSIAFLIIRLILTWGIAIIDGFNFSAFIFFLIPFTTFFTLGMTTSYLSAAIIWFIHYTGHTSPQVTWYQDEKTTFELIIITAGLIFVITMAQVVSKERKSRTQAELLLKELEATNQQLRDYATQVADLATTKERNRLAREIHDSLGHYLTVINIQLEKALAFRQRNSDEADQSVGNAKRLASEALSDIRSSVSALRESQEGFSLNQSLHELVSNMENSPFTIDLAIEGEEAGFSKQSLLTLYRAAQEGLTNVQKHAHAHNVKIHAELVGDEARLNITDDGQGFDTTILGDLQPGQDRGYGLLGVQERLALIRGYFQVESQPNEGTNLRVTVPKSPLVLGESA